MTPCSLFFMIFLLVFSFDSSKPCIRPHSAKYAKKVRKRLQTAIMNMTIGYQSPSAARSTAVRGQPRHSDDDRSESRASTAQSEGPAPAVMPASPPPQAAPAGSSEPGRGKAQGRAVPREQSHAPSVVAASRSKCVVLGCVHVYASLNLYLLIFFCSCVCVVVETVLFGERVCTKQFILVCTQDVHFWF